MKELNQTQIQEVAGGTDVNSMALPGAGTAQTGGSFLIPNFSNRPTPLVLDGVGFI
jgi:hypothetical protein